MNTSIRRPAAAILACLLASSLLLTVTVAVAAGAVVHYQHESYQDFQRQLAAGQIAAVTFNKKPHSAHITLTDGRKVLAIYPSHDEPQLAAALAAKGVAVSVEKHKSTVKPVHHTLRYIAGGILVIVILAILAVLLIGRRRNLADGGGGEVASEDAGGEVARAG
jgi:ATP-dependent Zn protease